MVSERRSCEQRIGEALDVRLKDFEEILASLEQGHKHPELGSLLRYASLDYVPTGTFPDQKDTYFRYRISEGEPCEEFHFYVCDNLAFRYAEYWLIDYFDDAHFICASERQEAVMLHLWKWLHMYGLPRRAMKEPHKRAFGFWAMS